MRMDVDQWPWWRSALPAFLIYLWSFNKCIFNAKINISVCACVWGAFCVFVNPKRPGQFHCHNVVTPSILLAPYVFTESRIYVLKLLFPPIWQQKDTNWKWNWKWILVLRNIILTENINFKSEKNPKNVQFHSFYSIVFSCTAALRLHNFVTLFMTCTSIRVSSSELHVISVSWTVLGHIF